MTTHHQYLNGDVVAVGCGCGWLFERRILSLEGKEGRNFPSSIQKKLEKAL
jgi:hypothetical protein